MLGHWRRLDHPQEQPCASRKQRNLPQGVDRVLDERLLHHGSSFAGAASAAANFCATRANSSALICLVSTIAMSNASLEPPNIRFTRSLKALPVARSRLTVGRYR